MPYEFLDDVATADMAFCAWGETLEETFVAAATAVVQLMVENLDPTRHHLRVDVKAVTLHRFRLQQRARGWEALVILDI